MLDSRDPETKEFRHQRYLNACDLFGAGVMTESTFRATLYQLGFRGQEISSEVNLHRPLKK